jgi:uncharacterized membrane protein YfcA
MTTTATVRVAHVGRSRLLIGVCGFAIGALTGLVGIGGGFLFVPALVLVAGLPVKQAVGTSLLVIAVSSLAGLLGYIGQVAIPWHVEWLFIAVASSGVLAGVYVVRFISQVALQRAFGLFLLLVAGFILLRGLS